VGGHGPDGAPPGSQDLAFGVVAEKLEECLVDGIGEVDRAVEFGQPHVEMVGVVSAS
jgi:hypothetical protein